MTCRIIRFGVLLFLLSSNMNAVNGDLTMEHAYEYYKNRDKSPENIEQAKKIYLSFIKAQDQKLSVRIEALHRFGRLSVFQGELARDLFDITDNQAVKIFKRCIKATNYLDPTKVGVETPEYTYWRSACIALLGGNLSMRKMILKLSEGWFGQLKSLIEIGQRKFKTFESYGFNNLQAGISIRSKLLKIIDLYNPTVTLNLMNESLKNGTDIYISYLLKAEAQIALHQKSLAKATLAHGIRELKHRLGNGTIPEDFIIENHIFLARMVEEIAKLDDI